MLTSILHRWTTLERCLASAGSHASEATPQSQMVEPEEKFSHTHREPKRSPKSLPGSSSLLHPREPREFNALNWFAALSGLSHQESNGDRTHVAYITGSSPLPFWFPIDLASLLRNRVLLSLDPGEKDFRGGAVTSHALLCSSLLRGVEPFERNFRAFELPEENHPTSVWLPQQIRKSFSHALERIQDSPKIGFCTTSL